MTLAKYIVKPQGGQPIEFDSYDAASQHGRDLHVEVRIVFSRYDLVETWGQRVQKADGTRV